MTTDHSLQMEEGVYLVSHPFLIEDGKEVDHIPGAKIGGTLLPLAGGHDGGKQVVMVQMQRAPELFNA